MEFKYKAKTESGDIQKGTVEADSRDEALSTLDSHSLTVVELQAKKDIPIYEREFDIPFLHRVSQRDLVVFSRELATLVGGEVAIVEALRSLSRQVSNPRFKTVISEVAQDVKGGEALSKALSRHDEVFSDFYINLVKSAEASGTLNETLNYLADYQERRYETISNIRGAMMYPAFVLAATLVIGVLTMIFIIPQLTDIFSGPDVTLPLPTKILITISNFLRSYWYVALGAFGGGAYGFWKWIHTEEGRKKWHKALLHMPYFGKIFRKFYLSRLASNLSTLLKGGISIIQTLEISSQVIGNEVYKNILLEAKEQVRVGKSISSVFTYYEEVPPMFTEMVKVGEKSGNMGEMLGKLSNFYRKEVDRIIERLSEIIEPVLIIILGAGVAFLAISIIMPIYNMTQAI